MARTISAILVDDEPGCLGNLQHYIGAYCPDIRIAGTAMDIDSAASLIREVPVDLAFLDVQLFGRTIFDLLPAEGSVDFPVVFVTAYEQYALSAFRVSALDYLLKPLEQAEILRCYTKIRRHFESLPPAAPAARSARILLRQGEYIYPTSTEQLLYLQAQGFYTNVCFLHEGKVREVMVSKPINVLHQEWENPQLMRVHRSYVINLQQVSSFRRHGGYINLRIADRTIPVAKRRVADFMEKYDA